MHLYHDLDFDAIGYDPIIGMGIGHSNKRAYMVQLACEYLLDTIYADYPEECVIKGYGPEHIVIDWHANTVRVHVKALHKSDTIH